MLGLLQRIRGLRLYPTSHELYVSPPSFHPSNPQQKEKKQSPKEYTHIHKPTPNPSPGQATYLTQSSETCGTIVSHFSNFTAHDLLAWNPELGKECFGLRAYVPVCINVPGYVYPGAVEAGDVWTAEQGPVPVMPGIVRNCTKFEYTDAKGEPGLARLLEENGVSRREWNGWNFPTQDAGEEWAVWAGYFSCVGVN